MSRITCLIIFSGSSARSTISFRFARIKVLTRSRSPMMNLLSKTKYCKPLERSKENRRLMGRSSDSRQKIDAPNHRCELHQPWHRKDAERDDSLKRVDRPAQKVVKQKTGPHHRENPNHEKFFIHGHCHPPGPFGVLGRSARACRDGSDRYDLPAAGCSGFGALSPIRRTLLNKSDICMPDSASNNAGTCAAILVMSPVSL